MHRKTTFVTSLLLLAGGVPAQQTLIVDAAGGGQFTSIQTAVSAADPGDTLRVRAGSYFSFRVDKPLRILGDDGVVVIGGCAASDLPPGRALVMRNLELMLGHPAIQIGLRLSRNAAPVHLDAIRLTSTLNPEDGVIRDCALVTLSRCRLNGTVALLVERSTVHMDASDVQGSGTVLGPGVGLRCEDSRIDLGATTVRGGDQLLFLEATPALELISGVVPLGAGTTVQAGDGGGAPISAVVTSGGTLIHDPGATIAASGGAPSITGPAGVQARVVPAVMTAATVGGTFDGRAIAPVGSVMTTFLNTPAPPAPTPFGSLWVALPLLAVDVGPVPAAGARTFSFAVPAGAPAGAALTTQSVTLHDGMLFLGTPSTAVFGPRAP